MSIIVLSVEYNDGAGDFIWHRWYVGQVKVRDYHEPNQRVSLPEPFNAEEVKSGWWHHVNALDQALTEYDNASS